MAAEETLLAAIATPLLAEAGAQQAHTGEKVHLLAATLYQADSWPHPRRIDYKTEALAKGPTTCFVVTSRPAAPGALYDISSVRHPRTLDQGCQADLLRRPLERSLLLSQSVQFRLILHAAVYWLLDTLRRWLTARGHPQVQLATLRLRLLKIGGRVREWVTHVRLYLAGSLPGHPLWSLLADHLPGSKIIQASGICRK